MTIDELKLCFADSQDNIDLGQMDHVTMSEAREAFTLAYNRLKNHGILKFYVLEWMYVAEHFGNMGVLVEEFSSLVFGEDRKALWNELTAAKAVMDAGFAKAWTGRIAEQPAHRLYVQALKDTDSSWYKVQK